mmetsp:Transcript_53974/g.128580  ORF Transcript_53974/g.128580 Transcript_53974/m.128580 type:complete len:81 (+) Transcript_53974:64-306(+)
MKSPAGNSSDKGFEVCMWPPLPSPGADVSKRQGTSTRFRMRLWIPNHGAIKSLCPLWVAISGHKSRFLILRINFKFFSEV